MYILNRTPTRAVDGKTSKEAFTGVKPDVSDLRVFGCKAYVLIPKELRTKLDDCSKVCTFMSYSTESKAYRLIDCNGKIVISNHMIFAENDQVESKGVSVDNDPEIVVDLGELLPLNEAEVQNSAESTIEPSRRSTRDMRFPTRLAKMWLALAVEEIEPVSVQETLVSPKWFKAMQEEYKALQQNGMWELTPLPLGKRVLGTKWVFKKKFSISGAVQR
ncbi:hypothetical protein R1sor_020052 [Riccia sorocarpa]|uniref:Retroviral polymerase SH3-like domain-containing protein n=1 Tax=Riccia sorocarpa TaxID=122646 RepID=A0ABD3IE72_9MARC